jgi:uncharacterized protein (DUF1684 family)
MAQKSYQQKIADWQKERNESLRRENGWLALSGLFWLKIGKNNIGSDAKCDVQLPERLPANLGTLDFDGKTISLQTAEGQKVKVNDKTTDNAVLEPDIADKPSFITIQDVRLVIIQRGNKVGVRMWDNQKIERKKHPERTWYPIDEEFRFLATYTPYEDQNMASFPDLNGEKAEFPVQGFLAFEFQEKKYKLDVNQEKDGTLFVRFWDPTSKDETYPTGRYLVAEEEGKGKFVLDFNKAYNPPCAFTPYATCVFAPEQNHLDFKITAGETFIRSER